MGTTMIEYMVFNCTIMVRQYFIAMVLGQDVMW